MLPKNVQFPQRTKVSTQITTKNIIFWQHVMNLVIMSKGLNKYKTEFSMHINQIQIILKFSL